MYFKQLNLLFNEHLRRSLLLVNFVYVYSSYFSFFDLSNWNYECNYTEESWTEIRVDSVDCVHGTSESWGRHTTMIMPPDTCVKSKQKKMGLDW